MKSTVNNYLGQYMCHGSIFTPVSDMPAETTTRGELLRMPVGVLKPNSHSNWYKWYWENNL